MYLHKGKTLRHDSGAMHRVVESDYPEITLKRLTDGETMTIAMHELVERINHGPLTAL